MPIDYSHIHTSRQIMRDDDVHTPIDPNASGEAISATDGTTTVDPATSLSFPSGSLADAGGGAAQVSGFRVARTTLTNAQIKGLGSGTTVSVVGAPGAGKVIVPFSAFVTIDPTAGKYTGVNATATINLAYVGGSDASTVVAESNPEQPGEGSVSALLGLNGEVTFASLGARAAVAAGGGQVLAATYDASEGENLALGLSGWNGGDGDFTGGHASNTGRVQVLYTVEDLA